MTRQSKWAAAQISAGNCRQCGARRGAGGTSQHCAQCAAKHRAKMADLMRRRRAAAKADR